MWIVCQADIWNVIFLSLKKNTKINFRILATNLKSALTFTTLLANSAVDKLVMLFWFFLENRTWYFMQTISIADSLHEMSNPFSGESKKNTSVCHLLKILPWVLGI